MIFGRLLFLLISLFIFIKPAQAYLTGIKTSNEYEQCINAGEFAQAECVADEFDRIDKRLNIIYKDVIASEKTDKNELKKEQRKWLKKLHEDCSDKDVGNLPQPYIEMKECLIIKTSLRIKELENMLGLVQKLENNTGNDHQHSEKIAIAESLKSKEEAKSTHIPTCEDNYKLCKDNTEIANSIHWASEASASCKRAAEKNAIATVDWGGWFQPNFGTFYKGDTGVKEDYMIFVDDVAKYKNAFNVDLKKTTTCKYNFKTKQVDYIDISP